MSFLITAVGLGFILGMRHAMDPDHLVAISTIVSRTGRLGVSWILGAAWGIGHTLTVLAVGVLIIALKLVIAPRLGLSLEFAVGLAMAALGAMNLAGYSTRGHVHPHDHEGPHGHHLPFSRVNDTARHEHSHEHPRFFVWLEEVTAEAGAFQMWRAFLVGIVHGLAGSAAVALLVLAAIPTTLGGVIYLVVFGFGTLAGMSLLSAFMEASFLWAANRFGMESLIRSGTGLASLLFGLYIIYQTGFAAGLFYGPAHWDPH